MLSHTLNDVPTIVKSPKFQRWIKWQRLTCIASHWVAHLRHRFQRFIHIQVSLNVTNIIEFSNLSVVLKKKNPNLYKCGFICSIIMRLFNVTQIILNIGVTTIYNLRVSLLDHRNCNYKLWTHNRNAREPRGRDVAWHWLSNEDYMQMNFKLK